MDLPKILITNLFLRGRSGTETHTRDLSLELRRRGFTVAVFSPDRPGPLVAELNTAGVSVVQDPRDCPFAPDVIHGHHNFALCMAIQAFPRIPALFVGHDAIAWHDRAPRLPNIVRFFAVDELCRQRVAGDANLPLEKIRIIGNSVDLRRFQPRVRLPGRPHRALVMNHTASETTFVPTIRQACQRIGLELTVVGAHSRNVTQSPETELLKYDLVFAKGRSAMEAMVCGCAVVLCGIEGVGPLVTAESFQDLRRWNFGRHSLTHPHSFEAISGEIAIYKPERIAELTRLARAELSLERTVDQWVEVYQQLRSIAVPSHDPQAWVDEWRHIYVQLDRLHTLEYENNLLKQAAQK